MDQEQNRRFRSTVDRRLLAHIRVYKPLHNWNIFRESNAIKRECMESFALECDDDTFKYLDFTERDTYFK